MRATGTDAGGRPCASPAVFDGGRADSGAIAWQRSVRRAGWTRTPLSFDSPDGGRVPAMLWEPGDAGPRPLILLAPGMPGTRMSLARLAEAYAAAGARVVSITPPYSRSDSPLRDFSLFTAPLFSAGDRTELIQYVKDVRRTMDLFLQHFDLGARAVAFVGHSYGGTVGAILAGVEPRLAAVALAAPAPGLRDRIPGNWKAGDRLALGDLTIETDGRVASVKATFAAPMGSQEWALTLEDLDATCFIDDARGGGLLLQFGRDDVVITRAAAHRLAGAAPAGTTTFWYDAGHRLSPRAWLDQAAWLATRIDIDVERFRPPAEIGG